MSLPQRIDDVVGVVASLTQRADCGTGTYEPSLIVVIGMMAPSLCLRMGTQGMAGLVLLWLTCKAESATTSLIR